VYIKKPVLMASEKSFHGDESPLYQKTTYPSFQIFMNELFGKFPLLRCSDFSAFQDKTTTPYQFQ